jgi:transmembrane sensor
MAALEWFVRMRDENVTAEDRRAFQAWLDRDPSHAAALARAEALWKRIDIVKPEIEQLRRSHRTFSRRNVIAGGAVGLIGATALYVRSRDDLFADHTTEAGERRTVALQDGSSVELGSYSALSVNFTSASRRVRLHRGQGFFDVRNDPTPFLVDVAGATTTALGAKFDVKHVDGEVTAVVSENAVTVRGSFPAMKVEQGWQVSFASNGPAALAPADLAVTEAWRRDQIIFQDVPLRRVLAEIERYRHGRIVLTDRRLGEIPVSAIFSSRQLDNALLTLANTLPIRLFQAGPLFTVVYSV